MGKHTEGPWGVWRQGKTLAITCTGHPANPHKWEGMHVAAVQLPSDERWAEIFRANANLIAAAPELLEALKWMVENDETNEGDVPLPKHNGQTWNEINEFWIAGLNRARAAIAKAEGA